MQCHRFITLPSASHTGYMLFASHLTLSIGVYIRVVDRLSHIVLPAHDTSACDHLRQPVRVRTRSPGPRRATEGLDPPGGASGASALQYDHWLMHALSTCQARLSIIRYILWCCVLARVQLPLHTPTGSRRSSSPDSCMGRHSMC